MIDSQSIWICISFIAFLLAPDPLNVTVGAVGEFFCRADADAVFWTVNDISVSQLADPNIYQSDGPVVDGFRTRILRIIADVQHSNSVIQCRSFTSGEGETPSDPVLLMVQGMWYYRFLYMYPCIQVVPAWSYN